MPKIPDIFSSPFWLKLCLHVKDNWMTGTHEHLYRAVRLAQKNGIGNDHKGIIIDAGCFDGKTTLFLSAMFPECQVYGFEPNTQSYLIAKGNTKQNDRIQLFNEALSSAEGEKDLHITFNQVSGSLLEINAAVPEIQDNPELTEQLKVVKKETVTVRTLDSFDLKSVLILKMDTQGNEMEILKGATSTLKNTFIVITEMASHKIYKGGCSYYETDAFLRENGFELVDMFIPYRKKGVEMTEYDAIYINRNASLKDQYI